MDGEDKEIKAVLPSANNVWASVDPKADAPKKEALKTGWKRVTEPSAAAVELVENAREKAIAQEQAAAAERARAGAINDKRDVLDVLKSIGPFDPAEDKLLAEMTEQEIKANGLGDKAGFVKSVGAETIAKMMMEEQSQKPGVMTVLVKARLGDVLKYDGQAKNVKLAQSVLDKIDQDPSIVEKLHATKGYPNASSIASQLTANELHSSAPQKPTSRQNFNDAFNKASTQNSEARTSVKAAASASTPEPELPRNNTKSG